MDKKKSERTKEKILYTIEELMNCEIDGERLVDICTKFTVIERTF